MNLFSMVLEIIIPYIQKLVNTGLSNLEKGNQQVNPLMTRKIISYLIKICNLK